MDEAANLEALAYHRLPRPGKLSVVPTKPLADEHDLSLAYSPGVAAACAAIAREPDSARELTSRSNLVAVITNGTAVLGLGDVGPLAAKPVMEGKAVLFKAFAGVDAFDLEVNAPDIDLLVEIVAALEPTFGAINLEDIRSPDCFELERRLRERMRIPVFHDDQHGTAVVCAAAVKNALILQGKRLEEIKLVSAGAGAAAIACVELLIQMGLPRENVTLTDSKGVIRAGATDLLPHLEPYARRTNASALGDVLPGADIFLGCSAGGVLKPEWLPLLADQPLILALANPVPEILPELVALHRPDAIVATGRSDYPNQVNNVLCFPFIFRGALDVGATQINERMKVAAAEALAGLARESKIRGKSRFGPSAIIPSPFDPGLITTVAPAVARAAMDSGLARRPITDFDAYELQLRRYVTSAMTAFPAAQMVAEASSS